MLKKHSNSKDTGLPAWQSVCSQFHPRVKIDYPMIRRFERTRSQAKRSVIKKYEELSATKKFKQVADSRQPNIVFKVYASRSIHSLIIHRMPRIYGKSSTTNAGTSFDKAGKGCVKLYDAFDKFAHIKGESLHRYYLRFTQLINDMNIYKMKLEQFQVNTKFLNRVFLTGIDFGIAVPVFKQGDDPIDAINKMMSFLAHILRKNEGIIQVTKGCEGFNCQGEVMARHCPKPKRKRDATWFRDKVLLVEAQGSGKVLNEEELEFLADPGVAKRSSYTDAKEILMATLSSYRSDVLFEAFRLQLYTLLQTTLLLLPVKIEALGLPKEKVFVITALKNDLRKFKGKDIVDNVAQVSNATTIAPGMYKLDQYSKLSLLRKAIKNRRMENYREVVTNIGYKLRPTGRTFTLVGNACPLTRITATKKVPLKDSSRSCPTCFVGILDLRLQHMMENRFAHIFVHKFLGTVKFGNDQIAKIMGYGDYQIGVDLLSGSRETNLYTLSIGDMMASSPVCLLSKASKTKSGYGTDDCHI
ncbi:hypothetical protein Tco_0221570 [Tanacetum coccineum]